MKVILISVDSLRGDFFELCEKFGIKLKALRKLRDISVFFPNTFVQTPYTLPSHASMLTGLHPFNHGLRQHRGPKLKKGRATLLDILKEKKIHTALFLGERIISEQLGYENVNVLGKTSLRGINHKISEWRDQDFFIFIHYWGIHTPYLPLAFRSMKNLVFNLSTRLQVRGYLSDRLYDRIMYGTSIKGVRILRDSLWRSLIKNVREDILDGEIEKVKRSYARAILSFDKFVSGIIEILKTKGLFDQVQIILTGDHGEGFNEHDEISSEPVDYMHGHFLYNNVLRVPTFLKSKFGGRLSIVSPIQTVDIMPTVLDFYEMNAVGRKLDGASLLKRKSDPKDNRTIYFETLLGETRKVGIIFDNLKIIRDLKMSRDYIFDLMYDPLESNNLAEDTKNQRYNITEKLEEFVVSNNISFEKTRADTEMTEEAKEIEDRLRALGYFV
ncbi:hypothetical protein ES703_85744 [subsurface metagenome]